jgi:hypothetical protein
MMLALNAWLDATHTCLFMHIFTLNTHNPNYPSNIKKTCHNVDASRGPRMTSKYSPRQSISLMTKIKGVKLIVCRRWLFIQMPIFCVHKFHH